jgi:hypothetical protein
MTRAIRGHSRAVMLAALVCGHVHGAFAQAPGTGTPDYTVLFRSQSTTRDFVALGVNRLRTLEGFQDLVCQIADDYRINIGASRTLELRMYRDIPADEYVAEQDLRFLDDGARSVFESQEEQVLAVYRWLDGDIGGFLAERLVREGRRTTPNIELLTNADGDPARPAEVRGFDHTVACDAP